MSHEASNDNPYTRGIARFVSGLTYDAIPAEVFDLKELTAGLGSVWQTMGVALKFYSCVGSNHTTLDAIREMQAEKPFGAKDVKKISVHGSQVTMDHVGWKYVPQGLTSAQLNLPYCIATWLLDGDCFVDQFTEEMVADPARMKLSDIVGKFEKLAVKALPKSQVEQLRDAMLGLDKLEDTTKIAQLLGKR